MRTWCRLALEMGCSLRECQERVSSSEFGMWRVFERAEGFPLQRVEHAIAIQSASLYNIFRGKGKAAKKAKDFIPFRKSAARRDPNVAKRTVEVFQILDHRNRAKGL